MKSLIANPADVAHASSLLTTTESSTNSRKILLVGLDETVVGFGIRQLAAVLNQAGHACELLFVPGPSAYLESQAELEVFTQFVHERAPDLVGISVMTNNILKARHLTRAIRRVMPVPVLWGGVHPTLAPAECLRDATAVCRGEGESAVLELLAAWTPGQPLPTGIPSIVVAAPETAVMAPGAAIERHKLDALAELPPPCFAIDQQWLFANGRIARMTRELMAQFPPYRIGFHFVLAQRGCPRHCSYCTNPVLQRLAPGPACRRRPVGAVIAELRNIREELGPMVRGIMFMDDSLFGAPLQWLDEFSAAYRHEIGLPLFCYAHPRDICEQKLRLLTAAGLAGVHMGLQSGCDRISLHVFNRGTTAQQFLQAAREVERHWPALFDRRYDIITDNPFEREEEAVQTLALLARLRKPFRLEIRSLYLFPGTPLREAADAAGIGIDDQMYYRQETGRYSPSLLNRALRMAPVIPGRWLLFLIRHRDNPAARWALYLLYFALFLPWIHTGARTQAALAEIAVRRFGSRMSHRAALKLLLKQVGV